jgi:hypothetical protein
VLYFSVAVPATMAASLSYEFDQPLSLRGDCGTGSPDFVPDPGCPGGSHPPKGRFNEPRSVAIDAYGNEYVASYAFSLDTSGKEGRIDIFDDEGNFISEFLDPNGPKSVAVDSKGNLYVWEQSNGPAAVVRYSPTVYEPGAGKIEYSLASRTVLRTKVDVQLGGLAVDPSNDRLYATYSADYLEEFSSAEEGSAFLNTIELPDFPGSPTSTYWNNWVAVDGQRQRLYASYCNGPEAFDDCGVLALSADPPYTLLENIDGSKVPSGKFAATKGWIPPAVDETNGHLFVADLQAKNIYEFDQNFSYVATTSFPNFEGTNAVQIAVSNSALDPNAKNRRALFVPLPRAAGSVFAFRPPLAGPAEVEDVSVIGISETGAELNATVNPNGAPTEYVFEYVTEQMFAEEGFANAQVAGTGTIPAGSSGVKVLAAASGLAPGTSYRFRIVAENEVPPEDEMEASFTTYADAPIGRGCGNELLRTSFSAFLPDCRAYELVTPADTKGRPPKGVGFGGDRFMTVEASPSGNTVAFVTEGGSLPGTEGTGGFNGDLYRTSRSPSGWGLVTRMGPTGTETNNPSPGSTSPDQEHAFFWASGEGSAVVNGITHWVRYPDGRAELVGRGSLGTDPAAEGKLITEGGTHIIFETASVGSTVTQHLEPEAAPAGTMALYDRTSDEVTHVVSLLPGDVPAKANEQALYRDASAEGAGIAFSIGNRLYLRLNNEVTYEIGEDVTLADVSEGGERVSYLEGGDLFAFDTDSKEVIRFTEVGNATIVNIASNGSRAYFVSTSAIGGENPNGATPVPGQQNLYLSEEGEISFVGTVTATDVSAGAELGGLGHWVDAQSGRAAEDPSRTTPDGSVLLFQSQANLDGYDSGGFQQVYRFDSVENRLDCLSCPPTRTPATGGARLETYALSQTTRPPFTSYGFVPNLRSDGARAFFESDEALVSTDTNGVQDVYEWEEQGVGNCARAGGCIYLISSGHSSSDNYLYGISRSGDDVFFITEDILVSGDNNTASIYDARVGGGFPEEPEDLCEGEGCHLPVTPPPVLTSPGTPARGADDNVKPSRRCPKGKRKVKRHGKITCVKKHRKKQRATNAGKGKGR